MKFTSLKALPILLGAIAILTAPFAYQSRAEEQACPDYFDDIDLSAQQLADIEDLEAQFDETVDDILPLSPETEEQIFALEDAFDAQVETLFSVDQQQQIEQIDQWAEEQVIAIAPELLDEGDIDEDDEDFELTPQQETALYEIEEEYEKRLEAILTADQSAKIEMLEEQLEEDLDTILPEPNDAQIVSLEAAESDLEASVMQLLSPEQQRQLESNLACYEDE